MSRPQAQPNGPRLVWDIETDGLLEELTKIHCIVAIDPDSGKEHVFRPHQIKDGLKLLATASALIGHNIVGFDLPALRKLFPEWEPQGEILDTLVLTRLHRPDLKDIDEKQIIFGKFPRQLKNSHSLEAWGLRIGTHKSSFGKTADWSTFSEEMLTYCVQDVRVNVDLFHFIERQKLSPEAVAIESRLALLIQEQEETGFGFDKLSALEMQADLMNKQAEITARLRDVFPSWLAGSRVHTVKTSRAVKMEELGELGKLPYITVPRISKLGKPLKPYVGPPSNTYTAGEQYTPIKKTEFNPGSRDHVANRLSVLYGWKPTKFTPDGKVQVDESVLEALPESLIPKQIKADLVEFYAYAKILGLLGIGSQAWLRNIRARTGRIHGRVITNGAVTGRATHRNPNIAQVPKVLKGPDKQVLLGYEGGWGWECRSLFIPQEGWIQVGCDASGLELRCLAHYLARFDAGEYTEIVTKGDPHEFHQGLIGLNSRDTSKTWIYAFIYGAGGWKLGHIANPLIEDDKHKEQYGNQLKGRFLKNFAALGQLRKAIYAACEARPYLIGLDGRRIYVRSRHSALNSLLQSAGAIICKQWIIEFHNALAALGLKRGSDYRQMAWVHDEIQIECRPELGELIGKEAVRAVVAAGESFDLKCPTNGEFKIGASWAETH